MRIAHNLQAMTANRNVGVIRAQQNKSVEKLASGFRINRAADDAAGLAMSEKMRSQARGLYKAVNNTNDAISLCRVADGALNEVHAMLNRIKELSVQSANGTNTDSDREKLNEEVKQILDDIERIGANTEFNKMKLFSGEIGGKAAAEEADSAETKTDDSVNDISETGAGDALQGRMLKMLVSDIIIRSVNAEMTNQSAPLSYTISGYKLVSTDTGISLKEVRTNVSNNKETLVQLSELSYSSLFGAGHTDTETGKTVYDVTAGTKTLDFGNELKLDVVVTENTDQEKFAEALNGASLSFDSWTRDYSTASFEVSSSDSNGTALKSNSGLKDRIKLTDAVAEKLGFNTANGKQAEFTAGVNADGRLYFKLLKNGVATDDATFVITDEGIDKIKAFSFGSILSNNANRTNQLIEFKSETDPNSTFTLVLTNSGFFEFFSTNLYDKLKDNYNNYAGESKSILTLKLASSDITYNTSAMFMTPNAVNVPDPVTPPETPTDPTDPITPADPTDPVTPTPPVTPGGTDPADPNPETPGDSDSSNDTDTTPKTPALKVGGNRLWIQAGGNYLNGLYMEMDKLDLSELGLSGLDISTFAGAEKSIDTVETALGIVSGLRSRIGAYQNRLEHTVQNLLNNHENTWASESRIRDLDYAKEYVTYTKTKTLELVGTAMLAYSNQNAGSIIDIMA